MSITDFAVDFGLTFFNDSSNKSTVTRKQYSTESVDFYNQSLEASTGISVDKDRWSDDDKKKEEEESININRIGTPDEQDSGENPNVLNFQQTSGSNNIVSNAFSTDFNNTPSDLLARTPTTYGQTLTKSGFKERAGVNFLGTEYFYAGVPTTLKGAGKAAKKGVFSLESAGKAAAKAVGLNSIVTGVALGFAKGKGVNDAFGNASFRPDHAILGGVFDTVQSIQYADVAANQAALASYTGSGMSNQFSPTTGYDHVSGRATGFNGYINGQLVTRKAGSYGYTGGFYDMDVEQMRAIEAISKGYIPTTFNVENETGERGVTPANKQGGFYTERGSYAWAGGTAAGGWMSDLEDLTETYFGEGQANVSLQDNKFTSHKDVIGKSLQQARDQYHWWGGKKDPKNTKSLSVIIADNIRLSKGITTPAQAIKDSVFKSTDPRSSYFKNRRTQEFGKNKAEKEAEEKRQADNIADAEAKSLAKYKTMVAKQQKAGRYDDGSSDDGSQSASDQASVADQQGGMFTAKGGFVSKGNNFALGGEAEPAGFIGGTPEQFDDQTTIADDIPLKVKDGTFVINAPAVEYAGSIDVQKMLAEGYEKAMTRDIGVDKNFRIGKIPSIEELDIQISRGEVVVPPHVAKVIGYDRLEKINNRGKREVERRQKAGNQEKVQAGQGFAAGGGEQNKLDPIKKYLSIEDVKKQFKPFGSYKNAKAARVEIARLLKSLPEEDALALAMYSEADVLGEEGLEGVAHVVMNRMKAKDNKGNRYRNFGKDMYNTLLATYEGEGGERIFEFNGLEPSGFRKALKAFTNKEDKYMQVRNIAEDVFKGSRKDFTKNSLYYYNPYTTTSDWYKGQVKTGKFKEVHRTLNPDKKQTKSVHVYHTPIDDYFQELEVNVIPQETPTEKFKPLDDLPQPIRRPNPEPKPDRSGGGGFMFRGVGKNYETEGIISIN